MRPLIEQEKIEKLNHYRLLNKYARKRQIVFAGSSLAEQFPVNELLNGYDRRYIVYNRGVSGDTAAGLYHSLNECVFELEPSKLFINIGSNDLNDPGSAAGLFDIYKRILLKIRERLPDTQIHLLSYYPVNTRKILASQEASLKFSGRTNESVNKANENLKELARSMRCAYIDVNSILQDSEGNLNEMYTNDGVHLLPNAYAIVLNLLVDFF
jgi:lysophospholipase L1-like esterase